MSAAATDYGIMRFSTDALPQRERLPMLRDFIGPMVARLEIAPIGEGPLHFEITARAMTDLAVSSLTFSPICGKRTRTLLADGNDNCSLSRIHSPGNTLVHRGREVAPGEDAGTLLSMADPFVCTTVSGCARVTTISVPRKVLGAMVPGLEDQFGLVQASEPMRLLENYVELLGQQLMATPNLRRLVVTHVHDLMALALGASGDAAEIAHGRGLRAARLHAIKADIRASLGEQGLSLTAVAARHGVTPRYVQMLFERDGSTFSQFLRGERLAHVHRMLRNPLHMSRSISALAYDAGFGDLSHFNRAFRQRYGATPSDVRAAAKAEQH
jgi:AraC-like DNA-binding protein